VRQVLHDGKARDAWTVSEGDALCIRHVVAHFGLDDDMKEHWLYEELYGAAIRQRGHRNVY
jgi:hypothetical protein